MPSLHGSSRRSHAAALAACVAGVACGAAASGNYVWNDPTDIAKLLTCMMMSGPFLTGYTQTINDWYDRDIDAINEPYRPIPSGEMRPSLTGGEGWGANKGSSMRQQHARSHASAHAAHA